MRATFLAATAFLLIGLLLVPAASAQQPAPKVKIIVKWEVDHEMILPENGKGDMGTIVEVWGEDFACAQPWKFKVEVSLKDPFAKWAGASMVPAVVPVTGAFEFSGGQPGLKQQAATGNKATGSPNTDAKLNLAWNVEDRPDTNAQQEYRVVGKIIQVDGQQNCLPSGSQTVADPSAAMIVKMFDKPTAANATTDVTACEENPARCLSTVAAPNEGGNAPGPDALIILLGLAAFVGLRRRNN